GPPFPPPGPRGTGSPAPPVLWGTPTPAAPSRRALVLARQYPRCVGGSLRPGTDAARPPWRRTGARARWARPRHGWPVPSSAPPPGRDGRRLGGRDLPDPRPRSPGRAALAALPAGTARDGEVGLLSGRLPDLGALLARHPLSSPPAALARGAESPV